MAKGPGRDQRGPMERLVRIAAVLATHEAGVSAEKLCTIAGFTGESRKDLLSRELRHLAKQGWQIDNVGAAGEDAVYVMRTIDNRLRLRLTPPQQTALRRAVLLANRDDLVDRLGLPASARPAEVSARVPTPDEATSDELSAVVRAVRDRSLLTFTYKGTARTVHPVALRSQNGTWHLSGAEDGTDLVKVFVVGRMSDVASGAPGTASPPVEARHTGLHPMSWEIDPPVEVTLRCDAPYAGDVRRWLGDPATTADAGDGEVDLTYRVTHRAALRARLNELGRRVRVVSPDEVRAEVVAALAVAAGVEGEAT